MPQLSSATSKCTPCIDLSQGPPGKKSGGISLLFKEIGKIRASYPIIYSKKFKPPGWCTPLLVVLIDLTIKDEILLTLRTAGHTANMILYTSRISGIFQEF